MPVMPNGVHFLPPLPRSQWLHPLDFLSPIFPVGVGVKSGAWTRRRWKWAAVVVHAEPYCESGSRLNS